MTLDTAVGGHENHFSRHSVSFTFQIGFCLKLEGRLLHFSPCGLVFLCADTFPFFISLNAIGLNDEQPVQKRKMIKIRINESILGATKVERLYPGSGQHKYREREANV